VLKRAIVLFDIDVSFVCICLGVKWAVELARIVSQ
jgi:hypothetical protein